MLLKNIFTRASFGVLVICLALGACAACGKNAVDETDENTDDSAVETQLSYDGINPADYITALTYKGMTVSTELSEDSESEALWYAICASAQIASYPEDKVEYYFKQMKKSYMYIANNDERDYELLLENRGTDEQKMRDEARYKVLEDLVYKYILEKEGIVLTEQDKTANFDRYAEKLALQLGKSESYIAAEMSEYVYDIMLHDKTMEYLMSVNTVEVVKAPEETTDKN